jgi:probable F420-dependent oxidoreductase
MLRTPVGRGISPRLGLVFVIHPDSELRFGVYLPAYSLPDEPPPTVTFLQDFARQAEQVGFDSLWVIDHLFEAPPSYRVVFMEPLASLAMVVGATEKMNLGTGILILPLRDPVTIAKEIATIDAASEGRVIFGIGIGWNELEFQACQVDKRKRGKRTDEMLEIIYGLWTEDEFEFRGEHFTVPRVRLAPKPVQRPHPPIWMAGGTVPSGASQHITSAPGYAPHRSLQRIARWADGFMTAYRSIPGTDNTQLRESWYFVQKEASAIGREPARIRFAHQDHLYIDMDSSFGKLKHVLERFTFNSYEDTASIYLMGHPEDLIPRIQARIDAGVRELTFNLLSPDPRQLELFMTEIRPHLKVQ